MQFHSFCPARALWNCTGRTEAVRVRRFLKGRKAFFYFTELKQRHGLLNVPGRKGRHMFNDLIYRLYPMMDEDGGAEGGAGAAPEPAGGDDDPEPMTFDEWLASNPEFQKEFDRRTTKGINTAVTKERARLNKLHDDQLTEAQRLASMTEDEKRAYQDQKREKELAEREAAITKRELEAEAKNTLADKDLPENRINSH